MKPAFFSFPALALTLLAAPVTAWADHNPDFDDDAKPILRMQAGLCEFVESQFQVKDSGIAKVPGDDDRHAQPPYIFQAKPRGYPGAYYITLLIQPGSPGHILKVVDPTKPNGGSPARNAAQGNQPPPPPDYDQQQAPPPPAPAPKKVVKAPAQTQSSKPQTSPTADTPSGPIQTAPSLEPPPDH